MSLLCIPTALPSPAESKPSIRGKTLSTRLPNKEIEAVEVAAKAAGQTCAEWLREAALAHLKRPARSKKPPTDAIVLAEIMGLRSLVQNLMAAASDLPEETVQRIVKHADAIKQGKAEEILKRHEDAHPEVK